MPDTEMPNTEMEVKGETLLSLPIFIIKKFGPDKYKRWVSKLSPEARKVYTAPIARNEWFPLKPILTEPMELICEMFYKGSMRGAWECGRYGAEYSLKGVYKLLVKMGSPAVLIKKGSNILQTYYRPSSLETVNQNPNDIVVRITQFPQMHACIENRIAGWMERAVEISGCRHVTVNITKSMAKNDQYTEFKVKWI